jgi:hypothetical protein
LRLAEVTVIPITTLGPTLDTLLQRGRDLRGLGREDRNRTLLTALPPWPYRPGLRARMQLERLSVPLLGVDVRRLEAFEAADEGFLVRDLADSGARRGCDPRAAGSGGGDDPDEKVRHQPVRVAPERGGSRDGESPGEEALLAAPVPGASATTKRATDRRDRLQRGTRSFSLNVLVATREATSALAITAASIAPRSSCKSVFATGPKTQG